jgi:cobalt/nickel transport system ATP-binding protein
MLEDVLDKLSLEGKTMLISTHDVDFVYRWAERVVVFSDGKIIADGTPMGIFKDQEVLKKANLKKPTMLEVYELLLEKGLLKNENLYPKTVQELKNIF